MNFFEHQRQAKQKTSYLVFLFFLAVVGLVIATNLAGWVIIEMMKAQSRYQQGNFDFPGTDEIPLYGSISLLTIMVIFFSALYKKSQIGGSGASIALYMGGTPAHLLLKHASVKRAVNVVEEMAIAAGMTPPPLYILTNELSINAFAAGMTPQNSVIALSQGCLDHLTRDELQGVVAHEMSHIFNGDTRLNVQLLGYLAGIVTIGVMGKMVMRSLGRSRYRSGSSKDSGGALFAILFAGFSLWLIGSLGVFVGRMIRSAVSRQREFLADASAVQFTRYPEGIAGALAKIQQNSSRLNFAGAEEVSHMCFENPLRFSAIFATHPPLRERIARVDKRFLDPDFLASHLQSPLEKPKKTPPRKKLTPQSIVDSIGDPNPETLATLGRLMETALPRFENGKPEALQAQAITFALLSMTSDPAQALTMIQTYASDELVVEYQARVQATKKLDRSCVLPSLHQCISKLRVLDSVEKAVFLKTCEYLIKSDALVDLYEVSLYLLLEFHLSEKKEFFNKNNLTVHQCSEEVGLLISCLASHGYQNLDLARKIFAESMQKLDIKGIAIFESKNLTIKNFRSMLQKLAELTPKDKERLVLAMLETAESDGQVNASELEFMKATCEYIGVPIPLNV